MPERKDRHFAGKVHVFNAGYSRVAGLDYEMIGSLMPTFISIESTSLFCCGNLRRNHSGPCRDTFPREASGRIYDYRFTNIEHVSGGLPAVPAAVLPNRSAATCAGEGRLHRSYRGPFRRG